MALLTADQILAAEDRRYECVEVPEWGGTVRVGSMTAAQRDRWDALIVRRRQGGEDDALIRATVVAFAAVDEGGKPVFTPDQIARLADKDARPVNRVFEVAARLNALTDDAAEEVKGN